MSQTENPINRSAYISFFRDCIEAKGFVKQDSTYRVDGLVIESILPIYKERLETNDSNLNSKPIIEFPPNYNPHLEVRRILKEAVNIIHQAGLVDILALKGASRFAGLGNITYRDRAHEGILSPTYGYYEYRASLGFTKSGDLKFPYPPIGKRNEYFKLEVGEYPVLDNAANLVASATQVGVELPIEHAINTGFAQIAAHEFGHGINYALDNQGVLTRQKALDLGFIRNAHLMVPSDIEETHREYFARAVEEAVGYQYLQMQHFTPDQAREVMKVKNKKTYYQAEAVYALMEYASDKGYSPDDLISMRVGLNNYMKDGKLNAYLYPLNILIFYFTKPYSEVQFRQLVTR